MSEKVSDVLESLTRSLKSLDHALQESRHLRTELYEHYGDLDAPLGEPSRAIPGPEPNRSGGIPRALK